MEKQLQKILKSLSGDIYNDSETLEKYIFDGDLTDNLSLKLELCKLLKEFCTIDCGILEKYHNIIIEFDIKYYNLYRKNYAKCYSTKNYEMALYYVNQIVWYFDFPQKDTSFDSILKFFIYKLWHPKFKGNFITTGEAEIFSNFADVCIGIGDVEKALECMKICIECSPLEFTYYEKMLSILDKFEYVDEMQEFLKKAYNLADDEKILAILQYYWAKYYKHKKQYRLSKVCGDFLLNKRSLPILYKKDLYEMLVEYQRKGITTTSSIDYYTKILKKEDFPFEKNLQMFFATLSIYGACIRGAIDDTELKNEAMNELKKYKQDTFVLEYERSIQKDCQFCFDGRSNLYVFFNRGWKAVPNDEDRISPKSEITLKNRSNELKIELSLKNYEKKQQENLKIKEHKQYQTIQGKNIEYTIYNLNRNSDYINIKFELNSKDIGSAYMKYSRHSKKMKGEILGIVSTIGVFST